MRRRILLLVLILPMTFLAAEEDEKPKTMEAWADRIMDRTREWVTDQLAQREMAEAKPLEKTLRLTFALIGKDGVSHPVTVTTAMETFQLDFEQNGGESQAFIHLRGQIRQQNDTHYLLVHQTSIHHEVGESETHIELSGSAGISIGKRVELATIGEQQVSVVVDQLD